MRLSNKVPYILSLTLTLCVGFRGHADTDSGAKGAPDETVATAPLAFADFSWAPGNYAPLESPLATKYFTPEVRVDTVYHYSFANPSDNTISGSSEVFRANEFQTTQIGVGGDVSYKNVGVRLMTQFGMYSTTTPRNDASPNRGQWRLADAYRYISEGYASYHLDVLKGINIQSGIFMSYVGLWSYYNFDNWTYQPSYVSSNTPWFFNGLRAQIFVNDHLKIEPWLVNGWQSYGKYVDQPGLGLQVLWRPSANVSVLGNQYFGKDTLATSTGIPSSSNRKRYHTDDSVMYKYFEKQDRSVGKAAVSLTLDAGCEDGGDVACGNQYFLGFMAYHRLWFAHDHFGLTFGGGAIRNPGRYLVLVPPINGADAFSGASPYYTANPGDDYRAWDMQITGDYMPTRNLTFRLEYNHREASVPYFTGPGGITPPPTTTKNADGTFVGWTPDLRTKEDRVSLAMMIRL